MINIFDEVIFSPGQKLKLATLVSNAEQQLKRVELTYPSELWGNHYAQARVDLTPGIGVEYRLFYKDDCGKLTKMHYVTVSALDTLTQPANVKRMTACANDIAKHMGFKCNFDRYNVSQFQDRRVLMMHAEPK